LGKNPRILKSERHTVEFYKELWDTSINNGAWEGEIWNRRKNGDVYPEWLSISTIKNINGEISHFVAVFNDISELKRKDEHIRHQAYHDPLTDLPNRSLFNDRLKVSIRHASRSNSQLAVIFLDLDHFKNVNDSLGHIVGDQLLQEVAQRLKACIRESDTIARIGGDEFVFLIENLDGPLGVIGFVERMITESIRAFMIEGNELFVTSSIGISIYPTDGEDEVVLLKNADMAMYHAKQQGRNNFQFYSEIMNDRMEQRINMENGMRKALNQDHFELYYQPIIDLKDERLNGVEALIRWKDPEKGMVSPAEFIPLAEDTGQIVPIGTWVLLEAVRQISTWQKMGLPPIFVSVNVSARQFESGFYDEVVGVLDEFKVDSNWLTVEITENLIMTNREKVTEVLNRLKDLGVSISIDDFGTGYSSLSYLKNFPLHNLKIDRSFVVDLPGSKESASIAKAIIAMAKSLGLHIVAEGVEDKDQLDFLMAAGCDKIQGYYYYKPMAAADLEKLLKK